MTGEQPECRTERVEVDYTSGGVRYIGRMYQVVHDGPCVFVDGECSCGRLDLGVVR